MVYWNSYSIPRSFLDLVHFHITLDNEDALARQDDLEYYTEVHITTSTAPLEGISYWYNANKLEGKKNKEKVTNKIRINKIDHPEKKKYYCLPL